MLSNGNFQSRTATGTNLYAQNWDSTPSQIPTLIFVIARQIDKPAIAWAGEAGLICRMGGMNDCGIGLGGNTLSTNAPVDFDGSHCSLHTGILWIKRHFRMPCSRGGQPCGNEYQSSVSRS